MAGDFRDIQFGYADAQTEGAEAPELLLDGFLDTEGLVDAALRNRQFIFLGYKGSGKTALAERAKLLAQGGERLYIKVANLDEFPYGDFKAAAGTNEPQTRYPVTWSWLLLVSLFELFEQDAEGANSAAADYRVAAESLRRLGLIPTPELNFLVRTSAKNSFKLKLPKIFGFDHHETSSSQDLQLPQAVNALKHAARTFQSESRHVLFLDGLDEVLGQRDLQFQALAALMSAATRLNNEFRAAKKPFKIVVLCRTDIYDRLPGANMNKIRQDHAEALNWYDDPANPDQTRLVRLINLRAGRSLKRNVDVFSEFLPRDVNGRESRKEVLDQTRHTPRDLVQLFGYLQRFTRKRGSLTPKVVRSGFRAYSIDYFLPEVRNELHGYLSASEIPKVEQLLTEVGSQHFRLVDLEAVQRVNSDLVALDVKAMAHVLFDCSVLGVVERRNNGIVRTIRYRNPYSQLQLGKLMWIHPAACRALNIQPGSPSFDDGRRRRQSTRSASRRSSGPDR